MCTVVSSNGTLGKKKKKKAKWPGLKYEVSVPQCRHVYHPNLSLPEQLQLLDSVIIDDKDPRQSTGLPPTSIYCQSIRDESEVGSLEQVLAASKTDNEDPQEKDTLKPTTSLAIATLTISLENDLHEEPERTKCRTLPVNAGGDTGISRTEWQQNEEKENLFQTVQIEKCSPEGNNNRCTKLDASQDSDKALSNFDIHKVDSWITASQQYFPDSYKETELKSSRDNPAVISSELYTGTLANNNRATPPPIAKSSKMVRTCISSQGPTNPQKGQLKNLTYGKDDKENSCLTADTVRHVLKRFVHDEQSLLLSMKQRTLAQTQAHIHMGKLSSAAQKLASNSDAVEAVFSALHKTRDELSKTLTEEVNRSGPPPMKIKKQSLAASQCIPDIQALQSTLSSENDCPNDQLVDIKQSKMIQAKVTSRNIVHEKLQQQCNSRPFNANTDMALEHAHADHRSPVDHQMQNMVRSSENNRRHIMDRSPEIHRKHCMARSPETHQRQSLDRSPENRRKYSLDCSAENQKWESKGMLSENTLRQSKDRSPEFCQNYSHGQRIDQGDYMESRSRKNSKKLNQNRWSATHEKLNSISDYMHALECGVDKDPCRRTIDKIVKHKRRGMLKGLNNLYRGKTLEYSEANLDEQFTHLNGLSLSTQLECTFIPECNIVKRTHYDVLKEWLSKKPLDSYIVGKFDSSDLNMEEIKPSLKVDETVHECLTDFKDNVFDLLKGEDITVQHSNIFPKPRNDSEDTVGKVFRQVHQYMDFVVSQAELSNRAGIILNGFSKVPETQAPISPLLNRDVPGSASSSEGGELHGFSEEEGRGPKSSRPKHKKKRKHKKSKSPEKRKRFQVVEYPSTGEDSDASELPNSRPKQEEHDCYKPTNAPAKKKISAGAPPKGISAQGMTHIMDEFYGDVEDLMNTSDMSVDSTGPGDQHLPPLQGLLVDTVCRDKHVDSVINEEMTKTKQHLLDILKVPDKMVKKTEPLVISMQTEGASEVPSLTVKKTTGPFVSSKQRNSCSESPLNLTPKSEDSSNNVGMHRNNEETLRNIVEPSNDKAEMSTNPLAEPVYSSPDAKTTPVKSHQQRSFSRYFTESRLASHDRLRTLSASEEKAAGTEACGEHIYNRFQQGTLPVSTIPCDNLVMAAVTAPTAAVGMHASSQRLTQISESNGKVTCTDQCGQKSYQTVSKRQLSRNKIPSHRKSIKRKYSPLLYHSNEPQQRWKKLALPAIPSELTTKTDTTYVDSFSSTLRDAYSNTPVPNFESFFDITKAPDGHFKNPYNQWWSIMQYFLDETRMTSNIEYLEKWLPQWEKVVGSGVMPENSFLMALSFATNKKSCMHSVDKQIATDDALEFDDIGGDINEYGSVPGSSDVRRSRTISTNSSGSMNDIANDYMNVDDGSRASSKKATPKRVNTLALAFRQAVEAKKMACHKLTATKAPPVPLVRKMKIKSTLQSKVKPTGTHNLVKKDTKSSTQKTPELIKDVHPIPYGEAGSTEVGERMGLSSVRVPANVYFEPQLNARIQSVVVEAMEDFASNLKGTVKKSLGQPRWHQTKLPSCFSSLPNQLRHLNLLSDQTTDLFEEIRAQNKGRWTVTKATIAVQTDCSNLPPKNSAQPVQQEVEVINARQKQLRERNESGVSLNMAESDLCEAEKDLLTQIPDTTEQTISPALEQDHMDETMEGNAAHQVIVAQLPQHPLIDPLPYNQTLVPIPVSAPAMVPYRMSSASPENPRTQTSSIVPYPVTSASPESPQPQAPAMIAYPVTSASLENQRPQAPAIVPYPVTPASPESQRPQAPAMVPHPVTSTVAPRQLIIPELESPVVESHLSASMPNKTRRLISPSPASRPPLSEPAILRSPSGIAPTKTSMANQPLSKFVIEAQETASKAQPAPKVALHSLTVDPLSTLVEKAVGARKGQNTHTPNNAPVVRSFMAVLPELASPEYSKNPPTTRLSMYTNNLSNSATVSTISGQPKQEAAPMQITDLASTTSVSNTPIPSIQTRSLSTYQVSAQNTTVGTTVSNIVADGLIGTAGLLSSVPSVRTQLVTNSPVYTHTSISADTSVVTGTPHVSTDTVVSTGTLVLTDTTVSSDAPIDTRIIVSTNPSINSGTVVSTNAPVSTITPVVTDAPMVTTDTLVLTSTQASTSTPIVTNTAALNDIPVSKSAAESTVFPEIEKVGMPAVESKLAMVHPLSVTSPLAIGLISLKPMEIPGFGAPEEATPPPSIPLRQYPIVTRKPIKIKPREPIIITPISVVQPAVSSENLHEVSPHVSSSSPTDAGMPTSVSLDAIPLPPSGNFSTDCKTNKWQTDEKPVDKQSEVIPPQPAEVIPPPPATELNACPLQTGDWRKHLEPTPPVSTLTEWPPKSASDPVPPPPLPPPTSLTPSTQPKWNANPPPNQQQYGGWYGAAHYQQPWSRGWGPHGPPRPDWVHWQGGRHWRGAPWGHPPPRSRGPWQQPPSSGFWDPRHQQHHHPPPHWGGRDQQQHNNHQGGDWGGQQYHQPKHWGEQPQQEWTQQQPPPKEPPPYPQHPPPPGHVPPPPGHGPPLPTHTMPQNHPEDHVVLPLPPTNVVPPHEEEPGEWKPPALRLIVAPPGEDSSLPVTLGVGRAYERPRPAQNIRILVFNQDQPICKSVQRFLTFLGAKTFDPYNVSALQAMNGIETLVLIHVEDVRNIHQVPNLLALKTQEWVTFVTYESVTDVQHKTYTVILKSGGIAVPDASILLSMQPESLEAICEFIVRQPREDGGVPWYLVVHSHVLSQLLNAREDERMRQLHMILTRYEEEGVVRILRSPEFDNTPLPPHEYLSVMLRLQAEYAHSTRHTVLLTDLPQNDLRALPFLGQGVSVMNMISFMRVIVGTSALPPVPQVWPYYGPKANDRYLDSCMSTAVDMLPSMAVMPLMQETMDD